MTDNNFDGNYFHHQNPSDYGDGRKVTTKILNNDAENSEYLLKKITSLQKETSTKIIHTNSPPRAKYSFGLIKEAINETIMDDTGTNHAVDETTWHFDNTEQHNFNKELNEQSFIETDYINYELSTAEFIDEDYTGFSVPREKINIPHTDHRTTNMNVTDYFPIGIPVESNYVPTETDKTNYSTAIFSSRAYAFTLKANRTGKLKGIDLNIITPTILEYPLIIELRNVDANRKPANICFSLTESNVPANFKGIYHFTFNRPATMEKDTEYAIVIRTPLTADNKGYALGGWTEKTSRTQSKVFISEDNANNFTVSEIEIAYKLYIEDKLDYLSGSTPAILYSKIINSNTPTGAVIYPVLRNIDNEKGNYIKFQFSTNGTMWVDFVESTGYLVADLTGAETVINGFIIRALIYYNDTSLDPPIFSAYTLQVGTAKAKKAALLTMKYPSEKTKGDISAWSQVVTNTIQQTGATVTASLVDAEETTTTYTIIPPTRIALCGKNDGTIAPNSYQKLYTDETGNTIETTALADDTKYKEWIDKNITSITNGSDFVSWLMKKYKVLLSGTYKDTNNSDIITYYMSKIILPCDTIYPIQKVKYTDYSRSKVISSQTALTYIENYAKVLPVSFLGGGSNEISEESLITLDQGTEGGRITFLQNTTDYPFLTALINDLENSGIYIEGLNNNTGHTINTIKENFTEFIDYTVDYESNTLTFFDYPLKDIITGTLSIKYNRVIMKGISGATELTLKTDGYTVNDNTTGIFELATETIPGGILVEKNYKELVEGIDFHVNYSEKTVTILNYKTGDYIDIAYIPHISTASIMLYYELTREDVTRDAFVLHETVKNIG